MLKSQIHQSHPLLLLPKPFIHGCTGPSSFPSHSRPSFPKSHKHVRLGLKPNNINAIFSIFTIQPAKVKAVVNVSQNSVGLLDKYWRDIFSSPLILELVSAELDANTGKERYVKASAERASEVDDDVKYEAEFEIPHDFGEVGAVFVTNKHNYEMFIHSIVLDGLPVGQLQVTCQSWVQVEQTRLFFTDKASYLPSKTPSGLKRLREQELIDLRGDGQGERKKGDRIYDYDVYNDLGNPDDDKDPSLKRPVLGGKERPYPRRCRTGRPHCQKDPSSEERSDYVYVPRDEEFSDVKEDAFVGKAKLEKYHAMLPGLQCGKDEDFSFPYFTAIDVMFDEGIDISEGIFSSIIKKIVRVAKKYLRFETPEVMKRDKFSWFRDEEFARQTLAGLNPSCIQLVTEWPLKSKLDPNIYGPPESAITTEIIEQEIKGFMTVDEAIKQKKLFILDYYDLLLPFVSQVRRLDGTTLYGSRTLFFLTPAGTLRPLAIELTRPPMDGKPQWKEVFTPSWDSKRVWLWRLAKAHALAHDSGYHQLITHWLRTHCVTEPYIIAANRQLSAMHPIYRLLYPHFRYTMEINAQARSTLINAGGVIETTFSPGKYSLELSSAVYDKLWRFDHESLPKDLIKRGMAVEDPSAPHGLKLTIEDYPYANDGLVLWDAIKQWVTDYVNHYYPDPDLVQSDEELQAWWTEVRTVGHEDKKDEPWWPELKNPEDLIEIITTIAWITSGHHAAVNFGQYDFAGYFPNRPTIARENMPSEDPKKKEWESFLKEPEKKLLETFPSQYQAIRVMITLSVLSNHSPDEEYIGQKIEPVWAADQDIEDAFKRFNKELVKLEGIIENKNANEQLLNRNGAGIVPYGLMRPFSKEGITGEGVPYSISI